MFYVQRCDQIQTINVLVMEVCIVRIRTVREVFRRGTVSHYYILVICKFIHFMSLYRQSVWFLFLLNNFPQQSLEYATYSSV